MFTLFNGFLQPIEVVSEITGISEKDLLIDDSYDVYVENPFYNDEDYIKLHIDVRRSLAYPIRIYKQPKSWTKQAGYYPEHNDQSYANIPALELPF
jgi:hypothetical protein